MPYLIKKDLLFIACTKPFRFSKKAKSAKTWNTSELAHRAIQKLKDTGMDVSGMMVFDANPKPPTVEPPCAPQVIVRPIFEVVEEKPEKKYDVRAIFSGTNPKCIACIKDCKQPIIEKIVYCPIYKESNKNG